MKTLREAKPGETVTVTKLNGTGAVKRRIMDMGITKGIPVYIRKVAPLGDPVEVTIRGYELSLRKDDAQMVEVSSSLSSPSVIYRALCHCTGLYSGACAPYF